jgi:hypothetical protein
VDWSNVITKLSLPKKLVKHAVGVGLSFPWHTFVIERMILDKMVRLGFLCYNIDTDLPSEHKFLTFGLGASFISFF